VEVFVHYEGAHSLCVALPLPQDGAPLSDLIEVSKGSLAHRPND
jgi:hypothetical protein